MAYSQVAIYGMNDKIGLVSYPNEEGSFNKPYSNETARMIDDEVRKMVQIAYERTIALLEEKKTLVTALAETLLQKDVSQSLHETILAASSGLAHALQCLQCVSLLLVVVRVMCCNPVAVDWLL